MLFIMQVSVPDQCPTEKLITKRPFLKRGEGIARFGMKSAPLKSRKKPQHQRGKQKDQVHHTKTKCLRSLSSPMLNSQQVVSSAGILAGQDGCEVRKDYEGVRKYYEGVRED
jgi:hypothetical protein